MAYVNGKSDEHFLKENVTVINSRSVQFLLTKLRNKETDCRNFVFYGDRLMRILAEEALARLPTIAEGKVCTPCGTASGLVEESKELNLCVVSIPRSGDILQEAVRQICPGVGIGKILIQRDESKAEKPPVLYYKKLPKNISNCFCILVDPMLATAGSANRALDVLLEAGVEEKNVMFINLICCPEGLNNLHHAHPLVKVVTCCIDEKLNEQKFIVPGLGDYGDRYYGTE